MKATKPTTRKRATPTKEQEKAATVLVLRTCDANRRSYGGFQWPESGPVECPDWRDDYKCGHGLHGLLWGEGDGSLLNWDEDAVWLVVEALESDVRHGKGDMVGKCKFPRGTVVFCGTKYAAAQYIADRSVNRAIVAGTATAGYAGTATAGYAGTATAGYAGTATAGARGTATAGDGGTATAGSAGTATAGERGTIDIKWWSGSRYRKVIGYVGEDGILPGVAYKCDDAGKLVPVDPKHAAEVAAKMEAAR